MDEKQPLSPRVLLTSAAIGIAVGAGAGLLLGQRFARKDAEQMDASVANLQKRAHSLLKELSDTVEAANSASG